MPGQAADTRARQAEALRALARCDQLVDSLAFFSRCALTETPLSVLVKTAAKRHHAASPARETAAAVWDPGCDPCAA